MALHLDYVGICDIFYPSQFVTVLKFVTSLIIGMHLYQLL